LGGCEIANRENRPMTTLNTLALATGWLWLMTFAAALLVFSIACCCVPRDAKRRQAEEEFFAHEPDCRECTSWRESEAAWSCGTIPIERQVIRVEDRESEAASVLIRSV
jgi:hypothetical protein